MAGSRNGHVDPGVSIRFGPVQDKDVKMEDTEDDVRGTSKRKSRTTVGQKKFYTESESSEEEDKPLVRCLPSWHGRCFLFGTIATIGFCN